jgi:ribosomal protein L44E
MFRACATLCAPQGITQGLAPPEVCGRGPRLDQWPRAGESTESRFCYISAAAHIADPSPRAPPVRDPRSSNVVGGRTDSMAGHRVGFAFYNPRPLSLAGSITFCRPDFGVEQRTGVTGEQRSGKRLGHPLRLRCDACANTEGMSRRTYSPGATSHDGFQIGAAGGSSHLVVTAETGGAPCSTAFHLTPSHWLGSPGSRRYGETSAPTESPTNCRDCRIATRHSVSGRSAIHRRANVDRADVGSVNGQPNGHGHCPPCRDGSTPAP